MNITIEQNKSIPVAKFRSKYLIFIKFRLACFTWNYLKGFKMMFKETPSFFCTEESAPFTSLI